MSVSRQFHVSGKFIKFLLKFNSVVISYIELNFEFTFNFYKGAYTGAEGLDPNLFYYENDMTYQVLVKR